MRYQAYGIERCIPAVDDQKKVCILRWLGSTNMHNRGPFARFCLFIQKTCLPFIMQIAEAGQYAYQKLIQARSLSSLDALNETSLLSTISRFETAKYGI